MPPGKARTVLLAAEIVGGAGPTRRTIARARGEDIESWLAGRVPLPDHMYQQCIEIVAACLWDDLRASHAKASGLFH